MVVRPGRCARRAPRSMRTLPVTAIIPAYNRPGPTVRAIESILRQSSGIPGEIIVVDDGSSDDTADAAEAAGARVIRHEVNQGLAAARNAGIAQASHEGVALLDSDDEWLPHHLDELWRLRNGHVLVATSALRIGLDA